MTGRVGPKGQVVIPKAIRDRLGIAPGGEVVFIEEGDSVRVRRARSILDLEGVLRGSGGTAELEREHRLELEKEERRFR